MNLVSVELLPVRNTALGFTEETGPKLADIQNHGSEVDNFDLARAEALWKAGMAVEMMETWGQFQVTDFWKKDFSIRNANINCFFLSNIGFSRFIGNIMIYIARFKTSKQAYFEISMPGISKRATEISRCQPCQL